MNKTLFRQVTMLTGDDLQVQHGDLLIEDGIIKKIGTVSAAEAEDAVEFARGEQIGRAHV